MLSMWDFRPVLGGWGEDLWDTGGRVNENEKQVIRKEGRGDDMDAVSSRSHCQIRRFSMLCWHSWKHSPAG